MMSPEYLSMLRPFILSWNLRNILEKPSMLSSGEFCITGTGLGEYPIDAWKTYFLEVPKCGYKKDLTGRSNYAVGIGMKNTRWNRKRIIALPIYTHSKDPGIEKLKVLIKHWNEICIPDDIPCLAIAVKCHGSYSESREAQSVTVLIIWYDSVSRVISLDWAEGPLEDCITPEWYVETTPLLNLREALGKTRSLYENISWEKTYFSIYTIPSCLGHELQGKKVRASYAQWQHEWRYSNYTELKKDLNLLFSKIWDIFFNDSSESGRLG